MRKLVTLVVILSLFASLPVEAQSVPSVMAVLPVGYNQLYIQASAPTTFRIDGSQIVFAAKWDGSLVVGPFQVSASPFLTVVCSSTITLKQVSNREFIVSSLDPVATTPQKVDLEVQDVVTPTVPTASESTPTTSTPTVPITPTQVITPTLPTTPSIPTGTGLYNPQTLQLAIQFRLSKINRQVSSATVAQIAAAVSRWANYFNLDPFLVIGLIEMESGFNPQCVSSASAVGLMQILEPSFYSYASSLGVKSDPFDIDSNIAVGCKMLSNSMLIWQRPYMALRAYLLGSTGLMNSVLSGSDGSDSKGTQSIKYANVVLSARDQIYQYFNLSTPKEQYVVVIDPGHGGFNPSGLYNMGAIGINNIYESEVVLDISLKVGQILKSYGLDVQYTRTKEKDPSNPYDLSDRLRLTESFKPNVLLSIHANSFTSSTANGVETYWRTSQSKWFSTIVHNQYLNQVQLKDRGVKQDTTLYMLQGQSYPSAMLEVGFITSPVDNALLSTADGQTKAAQGIAQGIIKFFGIDTKPLTH